MRGAVHGRPVTGVADPVPEMHLRPMELPEQTETGEQAAEGAEQGQGDLLKGDG